MAKYRNMNLRGAEAVFQALSDKGRLRILCALRHGELCICWIVEMLGFAPSTVSRHLSVVRSAGLIQTRKQERWVYCSLPSMPVSPIIGKILPQIFQSLENSPEVRADARLIKRILKKEASKCKIRKK